MSLIQFENSFAILIENSLYIYTFYSKDLSKILSFDR